MAGNSKKGGVILSGTDGVIWVITYSMILTGSDGEQVRKRPQIWCLEPLHSSGCPLTPRTLPPAVSSVV